MMSGPVTLGTIAWLLLALHAPGRLPATMYVTRELRPHVEHMLRESVTFRWQCRRLAAAPGLSVRVQLNPHLDPARLRARSVISRIKGGGVLAVVELAGFGNSSEWIAHEFEHIVEQLEGVEMARLADRGKGVWRTGTNMFESVRAIDAGRAVREETRRRGPRHYNNLVE
jgi:hypothetical protein